MFLTEFYLRLNYGNFNLFYQGKIMADIRTWLISPIPYTGCRYAEPTESLFLAKGRLPH